MGKIKRIKIKAVRRQANVSQGPETVFKPRIRVFSYNASDYIVVDITDDITRLNHHLEKYSHLNHWVDVQGPADAALLQYIEVKFRIHKLVLEDIVHTRQRPKLDEYANYLFAISRILYINSDLEIENEQLSFLLMNNKVLISFQQSHQDCTKSIIQRLESAKGIIRTAGPSYMMYALMDVVIDHYFVLIDKMGEELETIEELLYRRPNKSLMYETQEIKRAMIMIRRAAWPERDKLNDIIRSESALVTNETRTFLRDAYDHCMQVIDLVETYKDITTSLIEINLAFLSNRMNEIMKVLTIISSIFIPLTFIAGVYGMNFARQDPQSGKILHKNMPELYIENGYIYTMAAMLLIAIIQLIFFWRKGWLTNR